MQSKPMDVPYCGVKQSVIERAKPEVNVRHLLSFYQYVTRRYTVHLRKDVLKKPAPWTKDPVLNSYKFTNVKRIHDRETKWLVEHITNNPDISYEDKVLNTVLFRLYNRHETAELLGLPIRFSEMSRWDPDWYVSTLEAARIEDPGIAFFTTAFITAGLKRLVKSYIPAGRPKLAELGVLYFVLRLRKDGFLDRLEQCKTQRQAYRVIKAYDGIGVFLAYQLFVDLTYIEEFPFSENDFVMAGPGCISGLMLLFDDAKRLSAESQLFWLRDNIDGLFRGLLGKDWDPKRMFWDVPEEDRKLSIQDLENCLCEYSKYMQLKTGIGKPRKRY